MEANRKLFHVDIQIKSYELTRTSDLVTPRLQLPLALITLALFSTFSALRNLKSVFYTHLASAGSDLSLFFCITALESFGSVLRLRRMNSVTIVLAPVYLYEMPTHCTRCSLEVGSCDCGESDHL